MSAGDSHVSEHYLCQYPHEESLTRTNGVHVALEPDCGSRLVE